MRNWKRIISILLTAAMLFTMNTGVYADEADMTVNTAEEAETEEATMPEAAKTAAAQTSVEPEKTTGHETETQGETQGESPDETPEDDTGGDSPTEEIRVEETVAKEEITEEAQVAVPVEEAVEEVQEVSSNVSSDETKAQVSQGNAEGEAEGETAVSEEAEVPEQTIHYRAQENTDINSAVVITSVSNGEAAIPDHDYSISGDTIIVSDNGDTSYKGIVVSFKQAAEIKISANTANKGIVVLSANKDFSGVAKAELINGDNKALADCSSGKDTTVLIDKGSSEYGLFKYADYKDNASVKLLIAKEAFAGSGDKNISISDNGSVKIKGALGVALISGDNILQKTESSNTNYTYAGNGENDESGTYAAVFGTGDTVSSIISFKINHFATPDAAKISGNDRVKTNEFYFWLEKPVAGAEYKGAVFTGQGGQTLSKDNISPETGKYEFHATGLDTATTYYPAVRRVSGNGIIAADGVLYMPSEWSKHNEVKVTTKYDHDTVLEGLSFTYTKIGLGGATIQAAGENLGKFRIRIAVSVNNSPSNEAFKDHLLSYNKISEKYECHVDGLKKDTTYKVILSVNGQGEDPNEKGDKIAFTNVSFKTVKGYTLRFDKALPSEIPYRTTKAIGEYINDSATLYVNDTISLNTPGSSIYAVFYDEEPGMKAEPVIDYTVTTLKGGSETYLNKDNKKYSLYDYVNSVKGLGYGDTQTVSINAKLPAGIKDKDHAMTEPLAISHTLNYTKSTVLVSADNAVLKDKDHTLRDGDVKYKYVVEDLEGFDGNENVNKFISQNTTGDAVKAFGAYSVVDANGRSGALVSLNNAAGTGTIAINESNINLLSWNNAEVHKLFTDEKDIELKAYKTPSTFYVVPNAKDKITVTPSATSRTAEYGVETDSKGKTAGNKEAVEKIFKPVVSVAGSVLKSGQFEAEYLILSTNTAADTVAKNWDTCTVSGVELKSFHKGSTLYAYAKIKITGEEEIETFMSSPCAITIVPRRLKLYFNTDKDGKAVSSNSSFAEVRYDLNRDRAASFTDKSAITRGGGGNAAVLYNSYTHAIPVITGDGFDTSLMKADGSMIISDNVVLKGSGADVTRPGWQSVDFSYTRKAGTEDFEVTEQRGYIYVNAAGIFHVRLEAWIEGKQVLSDEYDLKYQDGGMYKLTELISDDSIGTKAKRIAALDKEDMGKLLTDVDGKRLKLIGWDYGLVDDGSMIKNNVAVGSLSETSIKAGRDYTFTARFKKYVTDGGEGGIYVETIPNVFYTGQTHKSAYWSMDNYDVLTERNQKGKYNNGTTVYDVQIAVRTDIGTDTELVEGIDYTVKLKNAKNASMEYDEKEGLYKLKNNDTSKRPQAVITGKGSYKGFTVTVYFNILPKAINEATVTGLLDTYYHNGKKLNKKIKVKATDACYWTQKNGRTGKKTMTLKAFNEAKKTGDYSIEIYRANENARGWTRLAGVTNPNTIKDKGHYLVVLVGHNNYTGINPYNLTLTAENEKSLMPQINDLDANQMFIETDPSFLLNNAKITLKSGFSILKVGDTVSASSVIDKVVINKKVVSADAYEAVFSEYYDENKKKFVSCGDVNTVKNAGSYRITIVPSKGSPYHGSKLSKKFKIKGIKLKAADLKDTLYYSYENSSGNMIYKKYNGTAIDYCEGKEIHIKISGNSTVSADHQFLSYTYMNKNNKPFDFTSFKLDQYSDPEYTYKSGTYKVTAYGLGPYYGSKVTVKYKIAGIDLNSSKYVGAPGSGKLIELGLYSQANYNLGGTMPAIFLSVNGSPLLGSRKVSTNAITKKTTTTTSYAWLPGSGITYKDKNGSMSFTIKVTNNTTVGKDATVTIKGKGGATGTWKKNFRVVRNSVTKVYSYDERGSGVDGYIYADVIDDKKGESERKVELYQAYYKAYDSKLKKAPIAFKKIGTSTKGEASECFKPTFHKVTTSSGSASGNKTTTTTTLPWQQVKLSNGTKTDRYYFAQSRICEERYYNWTKETKSIKYVTVSLNGARNVGKKYTLPMSGSIDFAGDDVSVVRKDSESETEFSSILLKDKSGRPLYVNNISGTVSADTGSLSKDENWIPLYDTPYTVTLSDGTTISQNYVIVSQKPARATSQGTVKITVKLVRRVPASVEEYKYGGKSKTFSYKIKKAANSAL